MASIANLWTGLATSPLQLVLSLSGLAFLYYLTSRTFDVFFGPLSKFPGPKLWAFTYLPRLWAQAAGRESHAHGKLHERYGPIVRVGPNELSFANGQQAWKDIYGHRKGGQAQPSKDKTFYFMPGEPAPSILGANDADHSRVRRLISPAFSEKAAKEQEPLVQRWMEFMYLKLSLHANSSDKVDLVTIFVCTTFDLMGELTFSENLNMLHDTKYSPWVSAIFEGVKIATIMRSMRQWHSSIRYLFDEVLVKTKAAERQLEEHAKHTKDRVDRRLQRDPAVPDLWSRILAKDGELGGISLNEQYANASFFMMAGAESTATGLSGITYHLLKNPRCLDLLQKEIRAEFSSLSEVTMERAHRLQYLNACISEGMRRYPPNPISLLRTVPEGGMTICDEYVPGNVNVAVNHYAVSHTEWNFKRPYDFIPERWLGDPEFKNDHLDASEPFVVGPRNCVGKNLAWHELRLLIIGVFLPFDIKIAPDSENWEDQKMWTFWEKNPLNVTVTPHKA